ncbi:YibE/F family protein [Catellatospora coxensis]|uniref:Membrane protein n=1 Tax=Catellatospora coxensis TaxID=310354 RepID=A0A8J3KUG0_9ACTN|nr:YibE/F family protein [Catellatospora coxensis]GIG08828.1 membrane protein [Catellatospora coxensis]
MSRAHDHDTADGHAGHAHSHAPVPVSRRATRLTLAALIPAAVLTLVGLFLLWPGDLKTEPWTGAVNHDGVVASVRIIDCADAAEPPAQTPEQKAPPVCGDVVVRLADGKVVTTSIPSGPGAPEVEAGDKVVVMETESFEQDGVIKYDIADHDRTDGLWALVLAFVGAVIAFGRWRGVSALAGLAFTFAVLLMFVVPAILQGSSPLLVAIVGSSLIMLVVLYLTHGFNAPTSMAVLGTLTALALTGGLSALSVSLLHLTGMASEESLYVTFVNADINMPGLLLAGILIGALGVLDDVTVTQAYTVAELANANPNLGFGGLYRAASRVGRAHITSVINTIVLAYAGASLPTLLLLTAGGAPLGEMLTNEFLAQEIVRSVVGTIGLISAVPITTALAALVSSRSEGKAATPRRTRPRQADALEQAWGLPPEADAFRHPAPVRHDHG